VLILIVLETLAVIWFCSQQAQSLSEELFYSGEKGDVDKCLELISNGADVNWRAGSDLVSNFIWIFNYLCLSLESLIITFYDMDKRFFNCWKIHCLRSTHLNSYKTTSFWNVSGHVLISISLLAFPSFSQLFVLKDSNNYCAQSTV